jgi:threonine/homoserine/homoserine lactone efflux protein
MTDLAAGIAIGFGAGIAPGPLLALVVTTAVERGFGAGARVAAAPLLTDTPIVALSVAVVGSVSEAAFRWLGVAGGLVVIAMGVQTAAAVRRAPAGEQAPAPGRRDVWRGVIVNVLSPHPWIFWVAAGGPLLVSAWRGSPARGVAFLAGFYGMLVGSKVVVAWAVARGSRRLDERRRRALVVVGGALLAVGGLLLLWQAATGRL